MSWSIDECVSTWATPHDVTVQWCIIAEALYNSRHPKGPHGMGMLVGDQSARMTFHHNLLAHNPWRNPLIQGRGEVTNEIDFRNNVIYDFGKFCSVARGRVHLNYVANYVKPGADSATDKELHLDQEARNQTYPQVFIADNVGPNSPAGEADNWNMVLDIAELGEAALRRGQPFAFPPVSTQAAADAYEAVLASAGAIRPVRDAVDARIIADVRNGTGAAIDSQDDVGGWPAYQEAEPPADTDHDAMPDAWETEHGLDPDNAADGSLDKDGDGYTNVEEYLNATDPTAAEAAADG